VNVIEGDLIASVQEGLILQQVNAQGVMGSGFAKALYEKYPWVRERYCDQYKMNQYHRGLDYMGDIQVVRITDELYVVNMVAQQFYGRDGKRYTSYDALDTCFQKIAAKRTAGMPIHHPLIGCGLGGAHWPVVEQLFELHLPDTNLWILPT
jgi:O-acetyl-ADP-ribose deacetylase (regulator of RNase III)